MLPGVTINDYHCYFDWGLYLAEKTIELPDIKTRTIEIPGMDGVLDVTDAVYGGVTYTNREIEIVLLCKKPYYEWPDILSKISNEIHGQKIKIVFDDDQYYKYTGRAVVEIKQLDKWNAQFIITVDADPYKVNLLDGTKSL